MSRAALVIGVVQLVGCAHGYKLDRSRNLGGDLIEVPVHEVPVRGAEVDVVNSEGGTLVEGELLSVGDDGIVVLHEASGREVRVPDGAIRWVDVEVHPSKAGTTMALTLGGTVLTPPAVGLLSLIAAPVWLLFGSLSAISQAVENDVRVYPERLHELDPWARHPRPWRRAGRPEPSGNAQPAAPTGAVPVHDDTGLGSEKPAPQPRPAPVPEAAPAPPGAPDPREAELPSPP